MTLHTVCGNRIDRPAYESLVSLNDTGSTFKEIAAIIRANPAHYFSNQGDEE